MSMLARPARSGLAVFAFLAAQVLSLALWVFYVMTWIDWWGGFGLIVGVITVPGVVIFPFLYWIVENHFPWNYFAMWAGIFALFTLAAVSRDD